jgi:hypothetical protein
MAWQKDAHSVSPAHTATKTQGGWVYQQPAQIESTSGGMSCILITAVMALAIVIGAAFVVTMF